MTDIKVDFSEVRVLAADLREVGHRIRPFARKAVEVTARGIKDDARVVAKGASGRHAKAYPNAITYDVEDSATEITAEIGPELGRNQGTLGFLEEGVAEQGTSPQHALRLAERANRDDFIRGLQKAAGDAARL